MARCFLYVNSIIVSRCYSGAQERFIGPIYPWNIQSNRQRPSQWKRVLSLSTLTGLHEERAESNKRQSSKNSHAAHTWSLERPTVKPTVNLIRDPSTLLCSYSDTHFRMRHLVGRPPRSFGPCTRIQKVVYWIFYFESVHVKFFVPSCWYFLSGFSPLPNFHMIFHPAKSSSTKRNPVSENFC